ncbi:MAG: hypothetical protein MJZ79_07670 [Paludibacteraceae bacterium]|nr:hypothetical protein [Paludibacteraceae bacterium]
MNQPIQIDDCSKVELHIHVLGYYPKGESILVVLWDNSDSSVLVSILIDCYQQKHVNRFESVLGKYGIDRSKLDYLIWTHPDFDHSLGLPEIIASYTSKKTNILVPLGYKTQALRSLNGSIYHAAIAVWNKAKRDKRTVVPISTSALFDSAPNITKRYNDGFSDLLLFSIEILAPYSEHSFHVTEILKSFNKNDISIAFNIHFGAYRFFFGGDAMNFSLSRIDNNRLRDTVFIKIPHHGSSTSDILPSLYEKALTYPIGKKKTTITSVTTTFEDHPTHLPEMGVLDKYKGIVKKILQTQGTIQNDNYGIWSFVYTLNSQVPKVSKIGDASVYFRE